MSSASRASTVSSFTLIKGALIGETYGVFRAWDFSRSKQENLERLRNENFIGARSAAWLRDVAFVVSRRFDPNERDRALVQLAKKGCDLEVWKPLLLWHMTRDEFLLRDFLQDWLFPAFVGGAFRLRPDDLHDYLRGITARGGLTEHGWTEHTVERVAAGLLKIAVDFGLLRGSVAKEFASYHLPDASFLYLLHAIKEREQSPNKLIAAADWRMYLMRPSDVEGELLRLHQFRKLDYQVAGSLVQLTLPCPTAREYADRMVE